MRGHLNAGDVRYDSLADHVGNAFGACPYTFRNPAAPIVVKVTNSREAFKVLIARKRGVLNNRLRLMGIYVLRQIKFFFNRGIISEFRRQREICLTIINYLDSKLLPWKQLDHPLQINMSSLMPRIGPLEATTTPQEIPLCKLYSPPFV